MQKENKESSKEEIIQKLLQAKQLIDECLSTLANKRIPVVKTTIKKEKSFSDAHVDFSKPIRPFIKQYASKLSGPKKFTLVLAYLVKGDEKKEVTLDVIKKEWNKMTGLLEGKFNLFYTNAAKDKDWVDTKTRGNYNLRPSWRSIFE